MGSFRGILWAGLWCVSLLCVLPELTEAATRKYVKMPSDSQVTGSGKASYRTGDKVFVPGDGQTEYIPAGTGAGSRTLPVDPTYQYGAFDIAKSMSGKLKAGNIAAAGLTIGLSYMLDQIGAFIDEAGNPVKHGQETQPTKSMYWCVQQNPSYCYEEDKFQTPEGYVKSVTDLYTDYEVTSVDVSTTSLYSARATAVMRNVKTGSILNMGPWDLFRHGSCDPGYSYLETVRTCVKQSGTVPLADADYDLMEAAAAAKDSEWLKQRLREHCEGSIAPQRCYDSLRQNSWLSGPATIPGGSTSTTGSYTKPDGTTGTTGTTTNTTYNIKYGDNYFDYSKTTVTTTTKDGQPVSQETTTEDPQVTEEQKPEEDIEPSPCTANCDGPAYSDLYTPRTDTKEQHLDSYMDRIGSIPIFQAATNIFTLNVNGSCPTWQLSTQWDFFGQSFPINAVFDFFCIPWFVAMGPFIAVVINILAGYAAYRIALL